MIRVARADDPSTAAPAKSVRQRLMEAAETLFSEHGWSAVGIRTIAAQANVSLAALNYHFGSKEKLLGELFASRAQLIVAERDRLLTQVLESGAPTVERVIEAFLRGALNYDIHSGLGGRAFCKLRARLSIESEALSRTIMSDAFDESGRRFIAELRRLLPDLPEQDLYWRFHCMLGSVTYTMADSGRIQSISNGMCNSSDMEQALKQMVPYIAAGFRAPAVSKPPRRRTKSAP